MIYQIYPRSFQDDSGDGVGDLTGITRRLPYVAGLGVDAIWLSPIFVSPMDDMGYDVSNYTDIDPLFGTLEDFDTLIETAHGLGLKVIVDQVLSHTSDKHPWFEESRASRDNPKADWYVWAEPNPDGSPPNNWASVFGGSAWEFEPRRRQYYLHNFLISQPDLNFHTKAVQDALLETMRFWLDRGLDGFRLDTVNYYFHDPKLRSNPPADHGGFGMATDVYGMQQHIYDKTRPENIAFLERLRKLTDQYEDVMMVGEVGEDGERSIAVMGEYTSGTDRLHMCYSFAMLGPYYSADHFRRCIEGFQKGAPDGQPKWSFSNHDVPRHVDRWATHAQDSDALARQAIAVLASFEGAIGIYQGEELGQTETELVYEELTDPPALRFWPQVKGRDGCRTPMVWEADAPNAGFSSGEPWLPVKAPQAARAVDVQEARNHSVLHTYREVLAFRKATPALRQGSTTFLDLPEPVLGIRRTSGDDNVTCLFNLSANTLHLDLDRAAGAIGPRHAALRDRSLSLPPNGYCYLSHEGALGATVSTDA
ncbi:Alpha amylase, catalytic subdomain [Oceanicola granulosus HTCC2516]|uniref:Alpha amylase, catalytic subdomain n=1 Tax=Oceanicola granulosus (strain ATCC BAA-861 / DSM 15982 / KCTC 12143 / HTCC2516) TaxID=314256 RepID=Q2CI82_OCEGH|nr:Alpha amylase, catalytic subdomain [Oceanicola granulosus HTCC2516]